MDPWLAGQVIQWTAVSTLGAARAQHTATLLSDGRVLVAGGKDSSGVALLTAEIYNATSNSWSSTGALNTARYGHTATLLNNAKVLLAGGQVGAYQTAELFDPALGVFSVLPTFPSSHYQNEHTATALSNGAVLLTAYYADVYNASGSWSSTANAPTNRYGHTATTLPDGTSVLLAGGWINGGALSSVDLFNSTSLSFAQQPISMNTARAYHVAVLLNTTGRVLVAGGQGGGGGGAVTYLSSVELYNPAARTWSTVAALSTVRYYAAASLLPNGEVVVVGGYTGVVVWSANAEIYSPTSNTWRTTDNFVGARDYHTLTSLRSIGQFQLLLAGGRNGGQSVISQVSLGTFFAVSPTSAPSANPSASPSAQPTTLPTAVPTTSPSARPSPAPTASPLPTAAPSLAPSSAPSTAPTPVPTPSPSSVPTPAPTPLCPVGFFCPGRDVAAALPCPPGGQCPAGSEQPQPCDDGAFCPGNSSAPLPCAAAPGFSCTRNSSTASGRACVGGFSCAGGATLPAVCSPGSFCPPNCSTPQACLPGGYCPSGSVVPTLCPAGTQRPGAGAATVGDCLNCGGSSTVAFYCAEGSRDPAPCPATFYCPTAAQRFACPPQNYFCPEGSAQAHACTACAVGGQLAPCTNTSDAQCAASAANTNTLFASVGGSLGGLVASLLLWIARRAIRDRSWRSHPVSISLLCFASLLALLSPLSLYEQLANEVRKRLRLDFGVYDKDNEKVYWTESPRLHGLRSVCPDGVVRHTSGAVSHGRAEGAMAGHRSRAGSCDHGGRGAAG